MAFRWPALGRSGDAWPGVTISGVVILAAAVLADAFGDPPRGGPRLVIGLALGAVLVVAGYLLRLWERRESEVCRSKRND
jgi:peptidoglycan/LPS O-acetylase OafA/YrhL